MSAVGSARSNLIGGQAYCPTCRSAAAIITDHQQGNELCGRCGLVLQSRIISEEQEWRTFSNSDKGDTGQDRNRVGDKTDEWFDGSAGGTAMIGGDRALMRTHEAATSMQGRDRLLKTAFGNLSKIKGDFNLKDVIMERCKEIAAVLLESDQLKGKSGWKEMLAVVYLACREAGTTRTLKELVEPYPNVTVAELGRTVNRLKKAITVAKAGSSDGALANYGGTTADTPAHLVKRYAGQLLGGLGRAKQTQVEMLAADICVRASEQVTKGYRPSSLASACLYMALQLYDVDTRTTIPVSEIASVAKTSEGTVRGCYKDLRPLARYVVPTNVSPPPPKTIDQLSKN
mmetsp:Transcript_52502/g.131965  ORF Transcript_52502/g.131965 Transcript_52502/m.131965 type:complete len:344 (+) Transcript_52502:217-1248(+)